MTRVAVTCIQLLRDLEALRGPLDARGWQITTPEIPGQHLEGEPLVAALQGCVGVIAGDDKFTPSVINALPDLRVISKWGIGVDGIDQQAADARGIRVTNTPGMFDDEVADVTMAYVVTLARDLVAIDRGIRAGAWPKPAGRSLSAMTLGVIGLGAIGRAVVRRAATAGMTILGVDPDPDSRQAAERDGANVCNIDELLERSDVISVNCPLNDETHHLLDRGAFDRMRDGAMVVNTGRGPVIDTTALVDALRSGRVRAAALDVLEEEPPRPDHPLRTFEQVVFGSHNASNTLEASARTHELAIENLIREVEAL